MTVTTSRDNARPIDWMCEVAGELMLQLQDPRPLSEIAADFEGCERFERCSAEEGDAVYEGYTVLRAIMRPPFRTRADTAQLILIRPAEEVSP